MIHELKTIQPYFNAVYNGTKTFELRKNDRDYKVGDILNLREYDDIVREYRDRSISKRVNYILEGGQFGLQKGFVILGLTDLVTVVKFQAYDRLHSETYVGHLSDEVVKRKISVISNLAQIKNIERV